MITFKQLLSLIILIALFTACGETPQERRANNEKKYQEQLASFKKDSLELLKEKMALFESFHEDFYAINSVFEPKAQKELSIQFGDGDREGEDFNTLYVNSGYFLKDAPFPMKHYQYLDNIKQLINGEVLTDKDGDEYTFFEFNYFRRFCDSFLDAKYLALERALEVKDPSRMELIKQGNSDNFVAGYYKTFFVLFRFDDSKTLLDNFILEATNDEMVEIIDNTSLTQNLLSNIRKAIQREVEARYNVSGDLPYRL